MKLELDFTERIKNFDFLSNDKSASSFKGDYSSVFKGEGIEFDSFAEYGPGSDAKKIDWVASSRSPKLLVRTYSQERNLNCVFLLDTSSSMLFSSTDRLKCEYAAELVANFSFSILTSQDSVGLVMFNDSIKFSINPSGGKLTYFKIIKGLSNESHYGGGKALIGTLSKFSRIYKSRCTLFLVTDLANYSKSTFDAIKKLKAKYEIIVLMIRDPMELEIPENLGLVCLEDPFKAKRLIVNLSTVKEEYNNEVHKQLNQMREDFLSASIDFGLIRTDLPIRGQLTEFFNRRRKKWN